jgi:uncharacterized protein YhfF
MIFKPELARAIMRGKKTQTRRRIKPGENGCRYKAGHSYAVQPGRGKTAICRLQVLDVTTAPLASLTQRDAIAEGFKTRAEFADYWMRLYDPRWSAARNDVGLGDDETAVLERFADRCQAEVWVITFQIDTAEQPMYLRARMGSVSDYTENPAQAAKGEPEAVPRAYQQLLTREAHERDAALAADTFVAERRSIEASIRTLEDHLGGPHVARRLELMRRELAAIDRDLKAAA